MRVPAGGWRCWWTSTTSDILGGEECLAEPFADIFSWFPATVTVDGIAYGEAGVRKKGFFGSLSSDKPSLKLRFDKQAAAGGACLSPALSPVGVLAPQRVGDSSRQPRAPDWNGERPVR